MKIKLTIENKEKIVDIGYTSVLKIFFAGYLGLLGCSMIIALIISIFV